MVGLEIEATVRLLKLPPPVLADTVHFLVLFRALLDRIHGLGKLLFKLRQSDAGVITVVVDLRRVEVTEVSDALASKRFDQIHDGVGAFNDLCLAEFVILTVRALGTEVLEGNPDDSIVVQRLGQGVEASCQLFPGESTATVVLVVAHAEHLSDVSRERVQFKITVDLESNLMDHQLELVLRDAMVVVLVRHVEDEAREDLIGTQGHDWSRNADAEVGLFV